MSEKVENKNRFWINPCDCGCGCADEDDDIYSLSYEIPGVDKGDIDLKVTKEGLRLIAKRGEIEYYNEFTFACEADVDQVKADYKNGLLSVQVPMNCPTPFKDAKTVGIS